MTDKNLPSLDENYQFLVREFLEAMNEIGSYGEKKHAENSFIAQLKTGTLDVKNLSSRNCIQSFIYHMYGHINAWESREPHNHFRTQKHQLAAAAFNLMMLFLYTRNMEM